MSEPVQRQKEARYLSTSSQTGQPEPKKRGNNRNY